MSPYVTLSGWQGGKCDVGYKLLVLERRPAVAALILSLASFPAPLVLRLRALIALRSLRPSRRFPNVDYE